MMTDEQYVMMTDEQYIDWLFNQEPCGYQNTPGFRAFLLDAMAAIGERPRAGDVASMHMAYTAGQEQAGARVWTDDRPTEPGEYYCSLHPSQRERLIAPQAVMAVAVSWNEYRGCLFVRWFDSHREECSLSTRDDSGGPSSPLRADIDGFGVAASTLDLEFHCVLLLPGGPGRMVRGWASIGWAALG